VESFTEERGERSLGLEPEVERGGSFAPRVVCHNVLFSS
jgi:hypothetical protein